MHLKSNMCETSAEQQTTVENTFWFDTKGMPTGRGLRRLMNQCSHPLPDRGFGPRLTVPLTKEQVVKAKKQGRFVRASKCVQQIIVTNPINPRSPCLLPCCNKYTKGVRRRYVNITEGKSDKITGQCLHLYQLLSLLYHLILWLSIVCESVLPISATFRNRSDLNLFCDSPS